MENVVREQIVHPDDIHKNQMLYQHRSGDEKHNEKSTQLCRPVDIWCSIGLASICSFSGLR